MRIPPPSMSREEAVGKLGVVLVGLVLTLIGAYQLDAVPWWNIGFGALMVLGVRR